MKEGNCLCLYGQEGTFLVLGNNLIDVCDTCQDQEAKTFKISWNLNNIH